MTVAQPSYELEAAELLERQVDNRQIDLAVGNDLERGLAALGLAADGERRVGGDHLTNSKTNDRMIVDHKDTGRRLGVLGCLRHDLSIACDLVATGTPRTVQVTTVPPPLWG